VSARREFSRKTRAEVHLRAGGCCEACGAKLKVGEGEYDHILPNELGGEPTADNCRLICMVCHKAKTAEDIRRIRKADRQRDRHSGALKPSSRPVLGSRASGVRKRMDGSVERWS
jgi:5-methylcytosine-specific restriction protein A